jgi:para-nitrobenzyl esterase
VPGTYSSTELAADIAHTIAAEFGPRPSVADLAGVDPRVLPDAGAAVSGKMAQYVDGGVRSR